MSLASGSSLLVPFRQRTGKRSVRFVEMLFGSALIRALSHASLQDAYLKLGTEKYADWEQKEKGILDPIVEAITPHHAKAEES